MIWILPAEWEVPWLSTVDTMLPSTTSTWLFSQLKKALRTDREGGGLRFLLGPPPGFKYCSDMLLCGLLGNKEGSVKGLGRVVGCWPTRWPHHTLPSSFTVIKMNRVLRGWAEVRASHPTSHKLTTQEVNIWTDEKRGRGVGEPAMSTDTLKTRFLSLSFTVLHLPNPVPAKPLWTGQVCFPR